MAGGRVSYCPGIRNSRWNRAPWAGVESAPDQRAVARIVIKEALLAAEAGVICVGLVDTKPNEETTEEQAEGIAMRVSPSRDAHGVIDAASPNAINVGAGKGVVLGSHDAMEAIVGSAADLRRPEA